MKALDIINEKINDDTIELDYEEAIEIKQALEVLQTLNNNFELATGIIYGKTINEDKKIGVVHFNKRLNELDNPKDYEIIKKWKGKGN